MQKHTHSKSFLEEAHFIDYVLENAYTVRAHILQIQTGKSR